MDVMRYRGSPWRNIDFAPITKDVHFDSERMYILLADERELRIPLKCFPILLYATPEQRSRWKLFNKGASLCWDEIVENA
jgi:hypothetical protein